MSKSNADLVYDAWATAWGPVGGVWSQRGLCRLVLPHYQLDQLLELLAWEHQGARREPTPFAELVPLTRDYFNARCVDFSPIPCELPAGNFAHVVLNACRQIPWGQTRSYSQLAEQISQPDAARAVATALGKNRIPLVIPCHRVTYNDGRGGGFSAEGGVEIKRRMLALEGVKIRG